MSYVPLWLFCIPVSQCAYELNYPLITALVDLARGIHKNNGGQHCRIRIVGQMRAKTNANIEWPIDVQLDGSTELVHRLAIHAHEKSKRITAFFDADALGVGDDKLIWRLTARKTTATADSKLHVFDANTHL